jgi:DNA polymerase III delta subunit
MTLLLHIAVQSNAGPGERLEALEVARGYLAREGVEAGSVVRIDVPGRSARAAEADEEEPEGTMRAELDLLIPMLQSGSLFGEKQGAMVVEAQNLTAAEGSLVSELLLAADPELVALALVSFGSLPAALAKAVKAVGETAPVRRMWERQAGTWLEGQLAERQLTLEAGAAQALVQRFGTDTASLAGALDQLQEHRGKITRELVLDRFRNRPDEPLSHYLDALASGNVSDSLRRLNDFLTHGHPLTLLATIENELKRRSLASVAPDEEGLRKWLGARSDDRRASRLWRERGKINDSSLRRAVDALVRAERVLKSQPEELHRVTLERLTVAMCRWVGSRR